MARKKLEHQELMKVTEALLLEKGYDGFHFKALAEQLNIGRSTIYEYYANKEELVTAYMLDVMQKVMAEIGENASIDDPLEQMKAHLQTFMKYSQVHHIIQMIPLVNPAASPRVKLALKKLSDDHKVLYRSMIHLIERGKMNGQIRTDYPSPVIASMFFIAIQLTPDTQETDYAAWGDMIFNLIYEGMG
ncbi:TetR/AcrR family transcriptional regulator [Bacillus marinisedimentorum]|uniref:TetR/AcrR family transcriptional regulator n=1 Tax=Bacillus marinisedimentorum TaxID=1821260 RepID=UPI0007DF98F0|nr:TetR/AcrR family transcriptional regulator [Bacillus marinisedimentorum]